jgi:YidC/Oxa1 family membrane protein insertase
MDNVRVILWAVLASLLWLAATQWQRTYAPSPPPELATLEAATNTALPALPGSTSDDVPAVTGTTPVPEALADSAQSPVINVKTNVLDVDISVAGGNLVNALLPLYPKDKDAPDVPVQLLNSNPAEIYVLRSGLRSTEAKAEATHKALYTAAQETYVLPAGQDELQVPLIWEQDGIQVIKTYTFRKGSYRIGLDYKVVNKTEAPYSLFSYQQLHHLFAPMERSMFNVDTYSYDGPVLYDGDSYDKLDLDDIREQPFQANYTNGWLAAIQHHFLTAAVPRPDTLQSYTANFDGRNYTVTASGPVTVIAPGASANFEGQFFVGPKLQRQLEATAKGLPLTVDYGILAILAQPLFWLLQKVHSFVGNWGWTIIIVTFLIKLTFYKLTQASGRSMAKMRKLQPRLKTLQERYKDDRQAMSAALMDLYKREKVNPAAGCLPMLVQIPFFIAFYWVLLESVEMRQAPFILWITDLSSRDPFFVLPLLMGGAMFVQQKLNPAPPDPIQAKVMSILPVVFTGFFAFFPAGLVLYWLTNSVLSILQQWNINRVVAAEAN